MTQTNPGYLTTLSASPSSRIVDGTDNIHSGIINSLNVASGGNAVVDGFDITQEDGGDYTRYVITSGKILRNGLLLSVSGATITPTAGSRSGNDWYATVVVAANNSLAIRIGAKDLSTASVSVLTTGDIPIAIVKYVDSSANDATNRLVQFLGYDQTTKGFSAINSGSETLRINADGTLTKGGSGTITLPASGTLATTSQVAYTSAIAEGNSGLVPSGGVASGNIANGAVTYGKMQNVSATNRILGRDSSGAGVVEEITPANVRTMLGIETGATADQTDAEIETAYNTRVAQVSNAEKTSGSATDVRRFSPADIKSMIDTHETDTNTDTDVSVANLKSKLSSDFGGDFTIGTQSDDTATISGNLVVGGNLTISGSTTTLDTETVALQDNILLLNSNSANTPSENAGVEVERGNSANVLIRWNESTDRWEFTNDGSNYHNLAVTSELSGSAYTHPNSVVADITTSGADVVQTISTNATGHVTALSKRTLSLGDLGYTGAADANKYVHPNHSGDVTSSADGATTIADNAVTSAKIATNAVTATEIANTTITNAQISNTAAIAQSKIDGLTAALSGKEPSLTIADGLDRTGSTLKIDIDGLTTENGMDRTADFIMYDDATENSNELRKINLANVFSKLIADDIPDISSTYRATATTLVNADISSSAAISADKIADGSTNKVFTSTLKTKLDGIATGATAGADWSSNVSNISVATAQIADSAVTNVKLANSGVTINSNSLNLGGTLTLDTDDFAEGSNKFYTDERVDDRVNALITDGEGITTTYDDSAGTLTVAAELATDSNKGVASFTNSHFVVNSGVVAIKDSSITNGKLAGSIAQSKITNLVSNLASKIENLGDLSVTASAAELNLLDGVPAGLTTTEIGYLDGVTSSIQTQLDSKLSSVAISDITGISSLDTDIGTTSANNDTLVSALAVKNYVDSKTTDLQTYSLLATDYTEGTNRAQITLRDSDSVDNHVVIAAGDGINVTRNGSNIVIVNSVLGETVTGAAFNQGVLTLTQQDSSTLTATLPDATTDAHGLMTDTQFDKLAGIEASADVTDKENVVAALALLDESDTLYIGDAGNDTAVRVRGNFFVDGTLTTVNQTEINVQDALVFEGATGDDYETTLRIIDPTADRVISLPDITGTVVTTGDSQTVATGMIANLGVTTGKINSNAVTSGKLATGAVGTTKLADDAVTTIKITDANVTTAKIADDAVTMAKIDGITDAGSGSVITSAERTKLSGIATGAEVNVQSDWNASSGDAKILNKPNVAYTSAIPNATASQTGLATSAQITKLDGIDASADVTDATTVNAAGAVMHTDIPDSDTGFIKRTGSETYDIDTNTYLTSLATTGLTDIAQLETNLASITDDHAGLATAKAVKAYVDSIPGGTGGMSFVIEDGDGTEVTVADSKEIKFIEGGLIDINWTDTDNGTDADPYDLTFTVDPLLRNYTNTEADGSQLFATDDELTTAVAATAITGKALTNLSTGSGGTVAATDTILAAFGKLENRVALNDAKVTNTDINVNVANLTARLPQITEDITIGDATDVTVTTSGSLIVGGNLTVNGTTTTIDTNTVNIGDNIIVLNSDETGTPSQDAGIEIERGSSSNKTLLWDEDPGRWTVGSESFVAATFIGNLTGDVTGNASTATEATNVTATANNSTDETVYPVFVDGTTGTQGIETDSGFTYNPSSGLLSTAGLTASGTIQYGSLSDGSITVTAFESSLTSGATLVPTSAAVKAYVDAQVDTADSFSEMADVSLTSPAAGHLAIYDATQSRWENATLTAGTNVSITNADAGITIASTDTTYTATATKGLALNGTAFSLDDPDNTNIVLMSSGANGSASNPAQRTAATGDQILVWDIDADGGNGEWAYMDLSHLADFAVDNGGAGGIKAFKTIAVTGEDNIEADASADILTLTAGSGVTIANDATNDAITFSIANSAISNDMLAGSITNAKLAGSIANSKLANDSVSFGGVSLDLGQSDATPAFDLTDATNYPTSSLTGTITNAQLAGSIANSKLSNSSITVSDGSNTTDIDLGGTLTFAATANETTVAESSGTVTIGLPDDVTIGNDLTIGNQLLINDGTDLATLAPTFVQVYNTNGSSNATVKMWAETWGGKVGTTSGDDFFIQSAGSDRLKFDGAMRTTFLGSASADPILRLSTLDTSVSDTDDLGVIEWVANYDSDGGDTDLVAASISAVAEADFTATANTAALVFKTATSEAATEKMRITNAGHVDLPNNDASLRLGASQQLELKYDGSHTRITHDAATDSWMIFKNEDGAGFQFNIGSDKGVEINKDGNVELYYDNSKKIETTSDGVTVSGDGTFQASGSPTLTVATTNNSGAQANLVLNGARNADGSTIGQITFKNLDNTDNPDVTYNAAKIIGFNDGGLNAGGLKFQTVPSGASTTLATALTIAEDTTITTASDLTVGGNLIVSGSTTTVNTATMTVEDHNIVLGSGNGTGEVVDGAGLTLEGGSGDDITFQYNTTDNRMELKHGSSFEDFKAGTITGTLSGNASTATALATARDIHGVSFDGSANIDLTEVIQDTVGAMFTGNTETNITATYEDGDGTIDLVVAGSTVGDGLTLTNATNNRIVTASGGTVLNAEEYLTHDGTLFQQVNATGSGTSAGDSVKFYQHKMSGGTGNQIYETAYQVRNTASNTDWVGASKRWGYSIDTHTPTVGYVGATSQLRQWQEIDYHASKHHFGHLDDTIMTIDGSTDRIGIGETSPDDTLHLKGSDGGTALLVEDSGSNSNPAVEIKNDAAHWKIQARGADSDKLRIVEGNNVHMVVKTGGNVGIGETAPGKTLHLSDGSTSGITGGTNTALLITDDANPRIYFEDVGEGSGDRVMDIMYDSEALSFNSLNDAASAYDTQNILKVHRDGEVTIAGELRGGDNRQWTPNSYTLGVADGNNANKWIKVCDWIMDGTNYDSFSFHAKVTQRGNATDYHELVIRGEFATTWWTKAFTIHGPYASSSQDNYLMVFDHSSGGSAPKATLYFRNTNAWNKKYLQIIQNVRHGDNIPATSWNWYNTTTGSTSTPTTDGETNSSTLSPAYFRTMGMGLGGGSDTQYRVYNGISGTPLYLNTSTQVAGLGIATPVVYSTGATTLQIHDATYAELRLTNTATGTAAGNGSVIQAADSDLYIWNAESGDISFATNSDLHMKLDENGNLGIGGSFSGHSVNGMLHVRDENDGSDQYSGIRFYPSDATTSATDTDAYHNITGFRKEGLMLSGGGTGNYTRTYATLNNDGFKVFTNDGTNSAVDMSSEQRLLIPTGGGAATLSVGLTVSGALSATTKSFDIEHPTEEGKRLHHGSLEGPEHGVYIRGRLEGDTIELPDYWLGLVDEDTITVQLTPNKGFQQIYVDHIEDNKVYVGTQTDTPIDCFYFIQAERKDVDKMEVEYDAVV